MKCCLVAWICSCRSIPDPLSRRSHRYCRRSVVYAIRSPSDFRCIRVLNSALVYCVRCTLGFRFPKKYAHQNEPLNQGDLHELKLRLKIVRYPGIEVGNRTKNKGPKLPIFQFYNTFIIKNFKITHFSSNNYKGIILEIGVQNGLIVLAVSAELVVRMIGFD